MSQPESQPIDATTFLAQLSVQELQDRLAELAAESRALRTLLRSLRAREVAERRKLCGTGGRHA